MSGGSKSLYRDMPDSLGSSSDSRSRTVRFGASTKISVRSLVRRACHRITIAMTHVLPVPVAIFMARRGTESFHSLLTRFSALSRGWCRDGWPALPPPASEGSASHIHTSVSMASI